MADSTPNDSLSPQLHNFVFLITAFMLFIWAIKAAIRIRSVFDLYGAINRCSVVRIDGLRQVGNISREHLNQILRARSTHTTSVADKVYLQGHVKKDKARIIPTSDLETYQLVFEMDTLQRVQVNVYLGLASAAVATLYSRMEKKLEREDKPAKSMRRRGEESRKESRRRGDESQKPKAALSLSGLNVDHLVPFKPSDYLFKAESHTVDIGVKSYVDIRLKKDWLQKCTIRHDTANPEHHSVAIIVSQLEANEQKSEGAIESAGISATEITLGHIDLPPPGVTPAPDFDVIMAGAKFDRQLVLTDSSVMEMQDVYGEQEVECTVCLTEPKDVILLPCRHMCICHQCHANPNLTKCPVCRAQIVSFLRFMEFDAPPKPLVMDSANLNLTANIPQAMQQLQPPQQDPAVPEAGAM